jgi:hypothetical protein
MAGPLVDRRPGAAPGTGDRKAHTQGVGHAGQPPHRRDRRGGPFPDPTGGIPQPASTARPHREDGRRHLPQRDDLSPWRPGARSGPTTNQSQLPRAMPTAARARARADR